MKIINLIEDFLQWIKVEKGYADSTIKAYEYDILLFLSWYNSGEVIRDKNKQKLKSKLKTIGLEGIDLRSLRELVVYLAQELD